MPDGKYYIVKTKRQGIVTYFILMLHRLCLFSSANNIPFMQRIQIGRAHV